MRMGNAGYILASDDTKKRFCGRSFNVNGVRESSYEYLEVIGGWHLSNWVMCRLRGWIEVNFREHFRGQMNW